MKSNQEKLALPMVLDLPIQTYLDYSLPLSVIAASRGVPDGFYTYGVQLFFPDSMLGSATRGLHKFLMCPALNSWQWQAMGLLEVETHVEFRDSPVTQDRLLEWMRMKMTEGWYLEGRLNEYFLRGRPHFFGRTNNIHINMVTGVDRANESVAVVGYGNSYQLDWEPVDAFYSSFTCFAQGGKNYDAIPNEKKFYLLRPSQNAPCAVDLELVAAQLDDYLRANSSLMHRVVATDDQYAYPADSGIWGRAVYARFTEYLRMKAEQRRPLDLRASRTLWEHKVCWGKRLQLLAGLVPLSSEAIAGMQMVESLAKEFRMAAFVFNTSRGEVTFRNMINLLQQMEEQETHWLEQVRCAFASAEVDPENWTGRIVNPNSGERSPCQRNVVSTVPSSKPRLGLMP